MTDPRVFDAPNPAAERRVAVRPSRGTADGVLWFAILAPPAAWSVDSLTAIALHHDYCAALVGHTFVPWHGATVLLILVGVVMIAVSLSAGVAAWRAHMALGDDTGMGDTDVDRRRFMARVGIIASALFSYGILLRAITVAFLGPQHCGS